VFAAVAGFEIIAAAVVVMYICFFGFVEADFSVSPFSSKIIDE
jgi:hypothetical protein